VIQNTLSFCQKHGIRRLEVFGAFASGTATSGSALDLLVTWLTPNGLGVDIAPNLFQFTDSQPASSQRCYSVRSQPPPAG
jgi:predicted nucleotidyltransferase